MAPADATTLTLAMADNKLGSILVDGKGMTLYLFTKDTPNTSNCNGQCLVAWPALLGKPTAGKGVDDSKLGSFTRSDGSVQASYNGWPLYYWKDDAKAGDATGQNVNNVWFVLDHDGNAIKG
jgi:predicted lipoprotein with Yx(FWY)xxD motif